MRIEIDPQTADAPDSLNYLDRILTKFEDGWHVWDTGHEAAECGVALHRAVLPSWARAEGLICIRATGDSMEPAIHDGDLVVLDRTSAEPTDGQTFVLRTGDGLIVKRLRRRGAVWEITSDNPRYRPRGVAAEERVIGRVAWSGPRRR